MDDSRFDDLARLLGAGTTRRGGLRAALGGLLGAGVAAVASGPDADARRRRRRRRCNPACPAGQTCVQRACVCDDGGAVCGANCCAIGQRCQGGTCVDPQPSCLAYGAECKGVGVACCENLQCASGQGGEADVACYVRKTGRCTSTAECVFGTTCEDGVCVAPVPPPPPPACTVCASGCPFSTIEAAVAAAAEGAVITIAAGTYSPAAMGEAGYLTIDRAMTLKACGDGEVEVECPAPQSFTWSCVAARNATGTVTLEELTLVGPGRVEGSPPPYAMPYAIRVNNEFDYAKTGSLALTRCTARGFISGGIDFIDVGSGSLTVDGSAYTGPGPDKNTGLVSSVTPTCPSPPSLSQWGQLCSQDAGVWPGCGCQIP